MFSFNCNGRLLTFEQPIVMGIINVTPDSFFAGSRHRDEKDILDAAERMLNDGATILDVGGQSSRPGSERISAEEELSRVIPAIRAIHNRFPEAFISIDTFYGDVAGNAVEAGASLVNDISGGSLDEGMLPTIAKLKVPYVLMHMQGNPQTMQSDPRYEDVTASVLQFFIAGLERLRKLEIRDVIIDPGFGFGKTPSHNFRLLRDLRVFTMTGAPILLGISRKSSIAKTLDVDTEETLNGTTVLNTIGLMNGASILRVHDVREAMQAIKLHSEVYSP